MTTTDPSGHSRSWTWVRNYKPFLSNDVKPFPYSCLTGKVISTNSTVQKRDGQKANKSMHATFLSTGSMQSPSSILSMVIEEVCTIFASQKLFRIESIVLPLWTLEIWGTVHPGGLITITLEPVEQIPPMFLNGYTVELLNNPENFVRTTRDMLLWGIYIPKFPEIFIFWGPKHSPLHQWWWNLALTWSCQSTPTPRC